MNWVNASSTSGTRYRCGYCGTLTSPSKRYYATAVITGSSTAEVANIYICSGCNKPTYLTDMEQVPGRLIGRTISHLPSNIEELYNEARKCISVGAYTSSVLTLRKLLMNIAVQEGAAEDQRFVQYVNYLEQNGFIPPKGRAWADKIRTKGNEATHEIHSMSMSDAIELLNFTEMLLIFIYEFPGTVEQ